jgi:hypothetical protein
MLCKFQMGDCALYFEPIISYSILLALDMAYHLEKHKDTIQSHLTSTTSKSLSSHVTPFFH